MKYTQSEKGFTIIETSLVLAIAGLILVMAFVALPALQRQTRDAKRKEDAATFMQALTKYQENNRGQLPETTPGDDVNNIIHTDEDTGDNWDVFYTNYLGDSFLDPSGDKYNFYVLRCGKGGTDDCSVFSSYTYEKLSQKIFENKATEADYYLYVSAACDGSRPKRSNNLRNVAMLVMQESGGLYCVDN